MATIVGVGTITLHLPGSHSLKAKRGVVKSLTARIHHEFNVSCAEIDYQDVWQSAQIGVAIISNDAAYVQAVIERIVGWIERNRPDVTVADHTLEIIS